MTKQVFGSFGLFHGTDGSRENYLQLLEKYCFYLLSLRFTKTYFKVKMNLREDLGDL